TRDETVSVAWAEESEHRIHTGRNLVQPDPTPGPPPARASIPSSNRIINGVEDRSHAHSLAPEGSGPRELSTARVKFYTNDKGIIRNYGKYTHSRTKRQSPQHFCWAGQGAPRSDRRSYDGLQEGAHRSKWRPGEGGDHSPQAWSCRGPEEGSPRD